jgi:hypothetical protein
LAIMIAEQTFLPIPIWDTHGVALAEVVVAAVVAAVAVSDVVVVVAVDAVVVDTVVIAQGHRTK